MLPALLAGRKGRVPRAQPPTRSAPVRRRPRGIDGVGEMHLGPRVGRSGDRNLGAVLNGALLAAAEHQPGTSNALRPPERFMEGLQVGGGHTDEGTSAGSQTS